MGTRTRSAELVAPLDAGDLEAWAEESLPRMVFDFVAGGAGAEVTLAENRRAFARAQLLPRQLRDVEHVDTSITLLGTALRAPMLVAPMALQCLLHEDGETAMARGALGAGLGMAFSTAASQSIEDVRAAGCPMWFQLYMQRDSEITRDLVARAVECGVSALCLTVDAPVPGLRRRDIANGFVLPDGVSFACLSRYAPSGGSGNPYGVALNRSATWEAVEWLRSLCDLPIVVKGILTAEDARRAIGSGASAVVVSNHGGRQLDATPASLDALPEIAAAVAGEGTIVFDSGIRHATDVAIALCLGADAVLVGRPALWALAYGGATGVQMYLDGLLGELERTLTLLGARSIDELDPSFVRLR
jgi:4-hydroxymandelate oxidase